MFSSTVLCRHRSHIQNQYDQCTMFMYACSIVIVIVIVTQHALFTITPTHNRSINPRLFMICKLCLCYLLKAPGQSYTSLVFMFLLCLSVKLRP